MTVPTPCSLGGVGEAPRHEVAGRWAVRVRLALWRLLRSDAGRGDPETVQQGAGPPGHAMDLSIF